MKNLRDVLARFRDSVRAWPGLSPRRILCALGLCALVVLFAWAARDHAERFNREATASDQSAYLHYAEMARARYGIHMDGARSPVYPFALLSVHRPGMDQNTFFVRAKQLTVWLTAFAWVVLGFMLRRSLPPLQALATWSVIGFSCLIHYAPYVKVEAVFFVSQAAAFLVLGRLFVAPTCRLAVLSGAVLGLSFLLKSSAGILLGAFLVAAGLHAAASLLQRRGTLRARLTALTRRAAAPALVVAVFLMVCSPFLVENKRKFGHYFYNVHSEFYLWYDSWGEAMRGTRQYGDRQGWPTLPESELPSAKKYIAMHSSRQMLDRLEHGAGKLVEDSARLGMVRYALAYVLAVALAAAVHSGRTLHLARSNWPVLTFTGVFLLAHALLSAWTYPIMWGPRVTAAGFPVLVTALAIALDHQCKTNSSRRAPDFDFALALAFAVGLMLAYDVPSNLLNHFAVARGGV